MVVDLSEVTEIVLGQKTPIFQRNRMPEFERTSFSLVYSGRSLDIICKDSEEFGVWITGLRALIIDPSALNLDRIQSQQEDSFNHDRLSIAFRGHQTVVYKREGIPSFIFWDSPHECSVF